MIFPQPQREHPYREYFVRHTDDAIIISDIEVPDQDPWMLKAATLVAMRFSIKHLMIVGDGIATDQATLNSWAQTWVEEHEVSYRTAVDMARQMVTRFATWFDTIDWTSGNHDDRIARKTGGEVTIDMLLSDTTVNFSQYAYMYIYSPKQKEWTYLCHPQNFAKNSVNLGQQLWAVTNAPDDYDENGNYIDDAAVREVHRNRSKCNVVLGHTHQMQSGRSPDDCYEIHALGCMRDRDRTKYVNISSNKHNKWNQGFLMMRDGKFYPLSRHGTDWETLLDDSIDSGVLSTVLTGQPGTRLARAQCSCAGTGRPTFPRCSGEHRQDAAHGGPECLPGAALPQGW